MGYSLWSPKRAGHDLVTAAAAAAKSLQSCPTLCDPIDGSPPGSPMPGILQARVLEWVAIAFSDLVTKQRQIVLFASRSLGRAQVCWISALFLSPCSFDLICREDLSTGRNGPWFSIHAQGGPENEPLHLQKEFPQ